MSLLSEARQLEIACAVYEEHGGWPSGRDGELLGSREEFVAKVRRLNAEGLNDGEIALQLRCSRERVQRCRRACGIPAVENVGGAFRFGRRW